MLSRRTTSASPDTMDEGPFVLGYAMCFGLMGVLSVQCFIYFTRFPNDRAWMRVLVAVVLLLETLITVFALHGFWVGVTAHNSDLSSIAASGTGGQELSPDPLWSFVALSPLTGIVSSLTHGFFCWRIWAVRQSLVVPVLTMMVSLLQCAMVTYGGVVYGLVPDIDASHPMPFYIPVWLTGSLFCDLMITAYMSLILLRSKSRFRNTWSLSIKLVKLTIETGLITTTAAIVELVLAIAFRVTLYHMALFYIISKLYANCLLATLNARLVLRSPTDKHKSVVVWEYAASHNGQLSHSGQLHSGSGGGTSHDHHRALPNDRVIQIHTQIETEYELGTYPMDMVDDQQKRVQLGGEDV